MSNENNNIASEMQHPELDIVDRLLTKHPLLLAEDMDLSEAAQEIRELRETVNDLTAWSEGVEADNDTLRKEIARLKEERNEIRRSFCQMVCDYEADAHGNMDTSKEQIATNNGWDCFKNEKQNTYICDHCGDPVDSNNVFFFHTLPQDIASANKGESATTCRKCCKMIDANANNQDFRTTDMG
jgi:rubrerythrin